MPRTHLTPESRRGLVEAALFEPGAVKARVAREHGISEARLYQLLEDYRDPERLVELEADVELRRRAVR